MDEYLQTLSFRRSTVEPCFYARSTSLGTVRLINYVDDTLYFANTDEAEEEFIKQLKARFNFHLLGTAHWYLGMRIIYNPLGATLDQSLYANSIVTKISKKGVVITPRNTPLPMDLTMTKKDCPTTDDMQEEVNNRYPDIQFRFVIDSLIYLSSGTRPDITYAVGKLAKFSHVPGDNHYKALT